MSLPMYLTLPVTSATSECIFCPQTTQELPNKHHEAGLPEQACTTAYRQMHCPNSITDTLDTVKIAKGILENLSRIGV